MMLTKRLQNKGRKLLAVTLSVFLVLSLVSFLSPIHAHAEGDNIPEKAPETCTEHLYSEEWMCEENGKTHFHECILCGEKLDIAEHIASDWIVDKAATLTKTGSQHKECTVCKIILLTEEIPVREPEVPEHIHQYEENWTFNETKPIPAKLVDIPTTKPSQSWSTRTSSALNGSPMPQATGTCVNAEQKTK